MTRFVLDNSVAMRWLMPSVRKPDQRYAEKVLESMEAADALVPELWRLEASNVLLCAERNGEVTRGEAEAFISRMEKLSIRVDSSAWEHAFGPAMSLARACNLTSYDAAYLELAVRESLMLASLDRALINAAKEVGVGIYLKEK